MMNELPRHLTDVVMAGPTSPLAPASSGAGAPPWATIAAVLTAFLAAVFAGWNAFPQRRTGREAAAAARRSADSSARSAKVAERALELNKETSRTAGIRADAEALSKRYQDAATQLGHDKPAVRLAGVYSMSRLADDWEEQRQVCIDVLCAYLRMPYELDSKAPKYRDGEREVRHTMIRVIRDHLDGSSKRSWVGHAFGFRGAQFDGGDFSRAQFSDGVDFRGAHFSGGTVEFREASFSADRVDFGGAHFSGSTVYFYGAEFSRGRVEFREASFSADKVYFGGAHFSGGTVDFNGAAFSGGRVDFNGAAFSGGRVDFHRAMYTGGTVDFSRAKYTGGTVDWGPFEDRAPSKTSPDPTELRSS